MWHYRERINYYEKVRRSLYEVLRDALQMRLMKLSLIDSFYNFLNAGEEYSFVRKAELKPKSKKMEKESDLFRTFIVIPPTTRVRIRSGPEHNRNPQPSRRTCRRNLLRIWPPECHDNKQRKRVGATFEAVTRLSRQQALFE